MEKKPLSRRQYVYDDLVRRIKNEEFVFGSRLPSFASLSKHYEVSIITIINALKQAEHDGYVECRQGSGTYVSWRREEIFFPFLHDSGARPIVITHTLLSPTPLENFVMRQLADCFMKVFTDVSIRFASLEIKNSRIDPYIQKITNGDMPCCGEFYWHALYAKLDALLPLETLPGFSSMARELLPQALYETRDAANESHYHAIYLNFGIPNHLLVMRRWVEELEFSPGSHPFSWSQLYRLLKHAQTARPSSAVYSAALAVPHEWHGVKNYLELLGQHAFGTSYRPNAGDFLETIIQSEGALSGLECLEKFLSIHPEKLLLDRPYENFAVGHVGMLPFAGSWMHHLLATLHTDDAFLAGSFPSLPGTTTYRPFYSGTSIGIFRDGISSEDQLYATWNWLKFLLSRQAQELGSQSMTLPVRQDAVPYIAEINPRVYQLATQALQKAVPQPDAVGMRRKFSDLSPILAAFLHREFNAKQCLQKLRDSVLRSRNITQC